MFDITDPHNISEIFIYNFDNLGIPIPDLEILPYNEYINQYQELAEHGKGREAYIPGVYLFADPCLYDDNPIYLYVGKSVKLKYRIRQHMGDILKPCRNSINWIEDYYDKIFEDENIFQPLRPSGVLLCLIWFEKEKYNEHFEMELITKLNPIYNSQHPSMNQTP